MRYTLRYRPPSSSTLPRGWRIVERPTSVSTYDLRTDLPVSEHPHGVVEFDAPLTADQIADFELLPLD
jgi:hypothetical protein